MSTQKIVKTRGMANTAHYATQLKEKRTVFRRWLLAAFRGNRQTRQRLNVSR